MRGVDFLLNQPGIDGASVSVGPLNLAGRKDLSIVKYV